MSVESEVTMHLRALSYNQSITTIQALQRTTLSYPSNSNSDWQICILKNLQKKISAKDMVQLTIRIILMHK